MKNLTLHLIQNTKTFTQLGGHNYTSTRLIDGFYTNLPQHARLTCKTLTNWQQNSIQYPTNMELDSNNLVKQCKQTTTQPPKITCPIPQENIQNLPTKFQRATNLHIHSLTQQLQNPHLSPNEWEENL